MDKVRITRKFNMEMAHALYAYDGKCANIHGHSYNMEVTLIGRPLEDEQSPKLGMLMDFSLLKKIVHEAVVNNFDHALVLNEKHEFLEYIEKANKVLKVPYQPSCENLLLDFVKRIQKQLPLPHVLHSVILSETASSYASWYASDN